MMAGTVFRAVANAASAMAASALMPALINSLFFAGMPSFAARCFSASITRYSDLGMVKLSRTSLSFLGLAGLAALTALTAAGADGVSSVLAGVLTGG